MALADLPVELVSRIVSYLPSNKDIKAYNPAAEPPPENSIAPYSTICKAWQPIVEERCFARLKINSDSLDEYERLIMAEPSRGANLRVLHFNVILPPIPDANRGRFERRTDQQSNDESFSKKIVRLFNVLSRLDSTNNAKPLCLIMYSPRSPSDIRRDYTVSETDIQEHRYQHSHIKLTRPEELLSIKRITDFICSTEQPRLLAPSTVVQLANKMPNLETTKWLLNDSERRFPSLRKQIRQDLGDSLSLFTCQKLKKFDIAFRHEATGDDTYVDADMRDVVSLQDPLGPSIRQTLSKLTIKDIYLRGPISIDGGLFWRGDGSPIWPHVETFRIDFSTVRPDGHYYFDRHPHDSDDLDDSSSDHNSSDDGFDYFEYEAPNFEDYDSFLQWADNQNAEFDSYDEIFEERRTGWYHKRIFRTYPNESIEPVLEAAARAAACMPHLKIMSAGAEMMSCKRTDWDRPDFEFAYVAAGTRSYHVKEVDDIYKPRLFWSVPNEWRMSASLEKLWRIVIGPSGIVKYSEW